MGVTQVIDKPINRKLLLALLLSTMIGIATLPGIQNANAEEPGVSVSEIKLGATYPQTGCCSRFFNDFFVGANSYFEHLNSSGGIYGRKITFLYKDDQSDPQLAINKNKELIVKDKVFALFNSAPTTGTYMAMSSKVDISRRQIPSLAVTAPYSEFSDIKRFPTTFTIAPNARQEAKVLLDYIKKNFPSTSFNLAYENNDLGAEFMPVWQSSGLMFGKAQSYLMGPQSEVAWRTDLAGVVNFGYQTGVSRGFIIQTASNTFPLFVRGASLNGINVSSSMNNVYANFHLPLFTDLNDPYISFYRSLFSKYASNKPVSQHMIEGANAAYVFSQAIANIGNKPTREKLIQYLRANSSSLSTAAYGPLDYSGGAKSGSSVQYIAKFDGTKWSQVSDLFMVDVRGNLSSAVQAQRLSLLPNGLPTLKSMPTENAQTITCIKGKESKKVTALNPKCPKGYKKK